MLYSDSLCHVAYVRTMPHRFIFIMTYFGQFRSLTLTRCQILKLASEVTRYIFQCVFMWETRWYNLVFFLSLLDKKLRSNFFPEKRLFFIQNPPDPIADCFPFAMQYKDVRDTLGPSGAAFGVVLPATVLRYINHWHQTFQLSTELSSVETYDVWLHTLHKSDLNTRSVFVANIIIQFQNSHHSLEAPQWRMRY